MRRWHMVVMSKNRLGEASNTADRPDLVEMKRYRLDLVKAEYENIRGECLQAIRAQQIILQWSLATTGIVLSAGLVLSREFIASGPGRPATLAYAIFAMVFGLGLPGFIFASSLVWFGELIRMERTGFYLRGLEAELAQEIGLQSDARVPPPLRWETFVAFGHGTGSNKQAVGYIGQMSIFTGGIIFSYLMFASVLWTYRFSAHEILWRTLLTTPALIVIATFCAVSINRGRSLQRLGKQAANLANITSAVDQAKP